MSIYIQIYSHIINMIFGRVINLQCFKLQLLLLYNVAAGTAFNIQPISKTKNVHWFTYMYKNIKVHLIRSYCNLQILANLMKMKNSNICNVHLIFSLCVNGFFLGGGVALVINPSDLCPVFTKYFMMCFTSNYLYFIRFSQAQPVSP